MQPVTAKPLYIRMHADDNVAIVANDGGLPAGTVFPSGLPLVEHVPQGHKVALVDIAEGDAVRRYDVVIGYALQPIAARQLGQRTLLQMPAAPSLDDLPIANGGATPLPPLEGYTFEGYRNADGSVGTRNILAITTTVQCVAGVVDFAVQRIKRAAAEVSRTSTTWWRSSTPTAAASRSTRRTPPSRSARCATSACNPNFGGEVMVVSLGCEKLQPERLLPPGIDRRRAQRADAGRTASTWSRLQDEAHVGFMSMIDRSCARPRST